MPGFGRTVTGPVPSTPAPPASSSRSRRAKSPRGKSPSPAVASPSSGPDAGSGDAMGRAQSITPAFDEPLDASERKPRHKTHMGELWTKYVRDELEKTGIAPKVPVVHVKVRLNRLYKVDVHDHRRFNADFVLCLDWIDPSVLRNPAYIKARKDHCAEDAEKDHYREVDIDRDHFSPFVTIDNADTSESEIKTVSGGDTSSRLQLGAAVPGHVKRTLRFNHPILLETPNLENYPFDHHNLEIKLKGDHCNLDSVTCNDGKDETKLIETLWTKKTGSPNHEMKNDTQDGREEWKCFFPYKKDCRPPQKEQKEPNEKPRKKEDRDELWVTICVNRNPYGVIKMLLFPLFVCVVLSICAFSLKGHAHTDNQSEKKHENELGDRLSLTATILLAIAAFHQTSQNSTSHRVPYETKLDKYMLHNIFMCLGQGITHVAISLIPQEKEAFKNYMFKCNEKDETDEFVKTALHDKVEVPRNKAVTVIKCITFLYILTYVLLSTEEDPKTKKQKKKFPLVALLNLLQAVTSATLEKIKSFFAWKVLIVPFFVFAAWYSDVEPDPRRSAMAVLDLVKGGAICITSFGAYCTKRDNPILCDEGVVSVLHLALSDNGLYYILLMIVFYSHVTIALDIATLFYNHKKPPKKGSEYILREDGPQLESLLESWPSFGTTNDD